jgi:hypothetical protein
MDSRSGGTLFPKDTAADRDTLNFHAGSKLLLFPAIIGCDRNGREGKISIQSYLPWPQLQSGLLTVKVKGGQVADVSRPSFLIEMLL